MADDRPRIILEVDDSSNSPQFTEVRWRLNQEAMAVLAAAKCTQPFVLIAYTSGRTIGQVRDVSGVKSEVLWKEMTKLTPMYRGFCSLEFQEAGPHDLLAFILWSEVRETQELARKARNVDFPLFAYFEQNQNIQTGNLASKGIGHADFFGMLTVHVGLEYFNQPVWRQWVRMQKKKLVADLRNLKVLFRPPKSIMSRPDNVRDMTLPKAMGS